MWILILSQTEHTKRLMEDPEWEGGQLVSRWMAYSEGEEKWTDIDWFGRMLKV